MEPLCLKLNWCMLKKGQGIQKYSNAWTSTGTSFYRSLRCGFIRARRCIFHEAFAWLCDTFVYPIAYVVTNCVESLPFRRQTFVTRKDNAWISQCEVVVSLRFKRSQCLGRKHKYTEFEFFAIRLMYVWFFPPFIRLCVFVFHVCAETKWYSQVFLRLDLGDR